jgi:hypothetical protein
MIFVENRTQISKIEKLEAWHIPIMLQRQMYIELKVNKHTIIFINQSQTISRFRSIFMENKKQ